VGPQKDWNQIKNAGFHPAFAFRRQVSPTPTLNQRSKSMSNKKKPQEKPTQKKHEIGVSYTDRDGRRRYVYRSDFPTKSEIVVVVQIRSSSVGQKRIVLGSLNRSRQEWRLFSFSFVHSYSSHVARFFLVVILFAISLRYE